VFALVHFLGYGQNSINKWVFGRGQVMDFTTVPPSFSTTTWSPTSSANSAVDGNSSSAYYSKDGELLIYFLNGKYYDSSGAVLPGGTVPNYYSNDPVSWHYRLKNSCFLKSFNSDTIYHYYHFQSPSATGFVNGYSHLSSIKLNRLFFDGNQWLIQDLDMLNASGNIGYDVCSVPVVSELASTNQLIVGHLTLGNHYNFKMFEITNQGFKSPAATPTFVHFDQQMDSLYIMRGLHFAPLTQKIIGLTSFGLPRLLWRFYSWHNTGGANYVKDPLTFPLVFPERFDTTAYQRIQVIKSALSNDGRYLFCLAREMGDPANFALPPNSAHLFRYDLLSADSLDFVLKAREIKLDTVFYVYKFIDLQVGPDNHLYFIIGEGLPYTTSNDNRVSRILNACEPDTSLISVQLNFATRPPFTVYHSFPSLSSVQTLPRPFQLITNCSDSVRFQFNLKNVPDSVWWDFGAPVLGAQNHSDVLHPWVRYPGGGSYYVTVELWLRGQLLRTMGDTIEVNPSPHVSLPNDTLLCHGQGLTLDARQGFAANYLWSTGSTDSTLVASQTGTYWVQVHNNCGTVYDTVNVAVIDPPVAVLRDTVLCDEWTHVLQVYADSANYLWSTGDTLPSIMPKTSNTYWVDITNPCGQIRDQAEIEVRRCMCNVWIPSAFTPNGDGVNESFEIKAECRDFEFTLDIFNRWGAHLYRQTDLNQPWDGKVNGQVVPSGIYTYRIQYWGREPEGLRWRDYSGTVQMLQ
jgi:gliding motility-associated-like protein